MPIIYLYFKTELTFIRMKLRSFSTIVVAADAMKSECRILREQLTKLEEIEILVRCGLLVFIQSLLCLFTRWRLYWSFCYSKTHKF